MKNKNQGGLIDMISQRMYAVAFVTLLAGSAMAQQRASELNDGVIKAGLADKNLAAQAPQVGAPAAPNADNGQAVQFPILAQVYDQDNPPTPHGRGDLELVTVGNEGRVGILYTEGLCIEPGADDAPSTCPHIIFVLPKNLSADADGQTVRLDGAPVAAYHKVRGWDHFLPVCAIRGHRCTSGFDLSPKYKLFSQWLIKTNDDGVNQWNSLVLQVGLGLADAPNQ
jgi:hypothetical protein